MLRPVAKTRAPACARPSATPRPTPRLAPVTSATCPFSPATGAAPESIPLSAACARTRGSPRVASAFDHPAPPLATRRHRSSSAPAAIDGGRVGLGCTAEHQRLLLQDASTLVARLPQRRSTDREE